MFYKEFNIIFVLCFFILNNFISFFKILPAEFLAGNFFIVFLCDHILKYLIVNTPFCSRQASLLFFLKLKK